MIEFVWDANVPWDLDKINKLDPIMKALDNSNFKICMSNDNFMEVPIVIRNKLKDYHFFSIDEPDEKNFNDFRIKMRSKNIFLDKNDSAVLYCCNEIDADFIVSSDTQVLLQANKYNSVFDIKAKAFHLLDLIQYLKKIGILDANFCSILSLDLYKKKEIPHLVINHGNELINDTTKRKIWITSQTKSCMDIFNNYKEHISRYHQL